MSSIFDILFFGYAINPDKFPLYIGIKIVDLELLNELLEFDASGLGIVTTACRDIVCPVLE